MHNHIVLSTKNRDNKEGLLLLNPILGDYSYVNHPTFEFKMGEIIEFYCPICHTDLTATDINENLSRILMIDNDKKEHEIIFSKISGENCTFLISGDKVKTFGEELIIKHYKYYFKFFK